MDELESEFAAELAKLRQDYIDHLPGELADIARAAASLTGDESERARLAELHHRLHKLAGSGGTFGFADLSREARVLEKQARAWLAGPLDGINAAALADFAAGAQALADTLRQNAPAAPKPTPKPTRAPADRRASLWLVEDDALLGQELAHVLGQFGYPTRLFTRIDEVEQAAALARPDALIMDVLFPAEGLNATEAVATRPALRALGCPLLFISAQGDFHSRIRAVRLGAAAFLTKPLDVPRLVDCLERLFDARQAAPYRVLIVDDDVPLAEHFRLVLNNAGMDAKVLSDPEKIIDVVAGFRPELILLDLVMPGYTGPELAAVIRQYDEWVSLPIVYLSAETDLDAQIRALGHGADDFLAKPISDARLVSAVRVRVARARQLENLMARDSLTGLLKHARIKEEVDIELSRARRSGKPLSVAMIDLDHFKSINDTYGHAVGDRVIKAVAHLMRQRLRLSDAIGRYGGEEFVAVLPDCDCETAQAVIEDIRVRFASLRFQHEGQEFACTLSAGVACLARHPGARASDLLIAADAALYAAKRAGRNRVCIADGGPILPER